MLRPGQESPHHSTHAVQPDEQLEDARQIVTLRHAPYVQVQRAKLALRLAKESPVTNQDLAELIGAPRNTVSKWRSRTTRPFAWNFRRKAMDERLKLLR